MEFRTTFEIQNRGEIQLNFGDPIALLGSCFSDRIGNKLQYFGFSALVNPFGTIFHPLNLAKFLDFKNDFSLRILERDGKFFAYETHTSIYAFSPEELENKIQETRQQLYNFLKEAKLVLLTFGTSFGHFLNEELVANCHKQPGFNFVKKMSSMEEMRVVWQKTLEDLKAEFPQLKVMFTVSPVRHTRDGMIENTLSKARLIELAHVLRGFYFPAYELLLDDLRDYRFYEKDMIHPNDLAVEYIFERFAEAIIAPNARNQFSEIHKFRMFEAHRVDEAKTELHQKSVGEKREILKSQIEGIFL